MAGPPAGDVWEGEEEMSSAIDKAKEIIYGDREKTYGNPADNLLKIAQQWQLYIAQKFGTDVMLDAEDVCYMMTQLKMVRQMNDHHTDNLVDGIGYLALIDRIANVDTRG